MTVVPVYTGEYRVEKGAGYDASNLKGSSVIVTGGASGIVGYILSIHGLGANFHYREKR